MKYKVYCSNWIAGRTRTRTRAKGMKIIKKTQHKKGRENIAFMKSNTYKKCLSMRYLSCGYDSRDRLQHLRDSRGRHKEKRWELAPSLEAVSTHSQTIFFSFSFSFCTHFPILLIIISLFLRSFPSL